MHCCTDRFNKGGQVPLEDYKQDNQQPQLEGQANRKLYDEEATVESSKAYPPAATMAPPQPPR